MFVVETNCTTSTSDVEAAVDGDCQMYDKIFSTERSHYNRSYFHQDALNYELKNSFDVITTESVAGAEKFLSGEGRSGSEVGSKKM